MMDDLQIIRSRHKSPSLMKSTVNHISIYANKHRHTTLYELAHDSPLSTGMAGTDGVSRLSNRGPKE